MRTFFKFIDTCLTQWMVYQRIVDKRCRHGSMVTTLDYTYMYLHTYNITYIIPMYIWILNDI